MPPPPLADGPSASQMQSLGGEFAIRGEDLLAWNPVLVDNMAKKGKSFKSGWVEYVVCLHQNMLYYYRDMRDIPSGCLCLDGCVVEAVDRIFKNMSPGDSHILAEECGPCFKITSRMGRSLLFRTRSKESRVQWIHMLQDMSYDTLYMRMQQATKERRELLQQVHDTNAAVAALHKELAVVRGQYEAALLEAASSSRSNKSAVPSPPAIVLDSPEVAAAVGTAKAVVVKPIATADPSTRASSTGSIATVPKVDPPPPAPRSAPSNAPPTIDAEALTKMTSELAGIARNLQQSLFSQPSISSTAPPAAATATTTTTTTKERPADEKTKAASHRMMMSAMEKIIFDLELEDELHRTRMLAGGRSSTNPQTISSSAPPLYQSFLTSSSNMVPHRDPLTTPIVLLAESPSAFRQPKGEDGGDDAGWSTPKPQAKAAPPDYAVDEYDARSDVSSFYLGDRRKNSIISDMDVQRGDTLASLLVRSDMVVVTALLNTCQRSDKMALLFPLLRIFGSRNALFMLMQWSIDMEVQSALSLATLFRSDDYSSRLLSTYAKAVGLRFIHTALADHIRALCTDKTKYSCSDFELNIIKDPSLSDPAKLQRNADNLMQVCQNIVDSILNHMDELPLSFVHVCRYLKEKLIERFLDAEDDYDGSSSPIKAIMGGFLFLRFICPAITTPHSYGLLDQIPDASSRRILVLVTKLLFNCSTDVEFGVKEAYMRIVNGFIVQNAPRMAFLYTRLTAKRDGEIEQCFTADADGIFTQISADQLYQDRDEIIGAMGKHVDEVVAKVAVSSEPLASQLQTLMSVPPQQTSTGSLTVADTSPEEKHPTLQKSKGSIMSFFKKNPSVTSVLT
ncbi:hypothetical protein, variant 1 [Aphanomyces invadans]|uniref:Ras-GAP domain-containing protein n=1 Tax=Aphanomyces invadans TaxID=157072 RepID=A0A024UJB0_9STRA|nr:hypothetical protein, variant 1 [Aphanomyces invadans]ETW06379.1 hypothetical protein, variant 1 [Aphanomyces invadans]|eukprot:XP_008864454.1 hypothetical protein, variant 1 [Aphanomyces invadans]